MFLSRHSEEVDKPLSSAASPPDSNMEVIDTPFINKDGEWEVSCGDIEAISIGAGILGAGGGGSPYIGKHRAWKTLNSGKKIRVVTPER